jgi:hypothetical protein
MCCNTCWLAVWVHANVVCGYDDMELAGEVFNGLQIFSNVLSLTLRNYRHTHS